MGPESILRFIMMRSLFLEGYTLKCNKKNSHCAFCFSAIVILFNLLWSNLGATQDTSHLTSLPTKQSLFTTHLNVGVITLFPFTSYKNEQLGGLSYDIWRLIAIKNNFNCTYFNLISDVDKATQLVHNHKLDVVIGPIGIISQRVPLVDYTTPYFHGQYVLLAKQQKLSIWLQLHAFFGKLSEVGFIFIALFFTVYIHLFWAIERKSSPDLKGLTYRKGMGYIFWRCMLNQFKAPFFPSSLVIRILSFIWFIVFTLFLTSIFAGLTASFVSNVLSKGEPFQKILDVGKKPIAAFGGKAATNFAMRAGLNVTYLPKTMNEAVTALDSRKVDGIFLLLGSAHAYLNKHSRDDLYISPIQFQHIPMGFMVSDTNRELLRKINWSLLKMSEDGTKLYICDQYNSFINTINCQ